MIITLVHGLYYDAKCDKKLYEVRTRKIMLIANSIAGSSSVISALVTKNPKNLDIGQLLLAAVIVANYHVLYYIPVLLVAGTVTGLLIGILSQTMIVRLGTVLIWERREQ